MPGRHLLDSSIVIPYRANDPEVVQQVTEADEVFVSVIVLGELLFGALKSPRPEANRAWLESFASRVTVLDCDAEVAWIYADIRNSLRLAGNPIPENDLWIAATAIRHGLQLAARDKHFDTVPGLKLSGW